SSSVPLCPEAEAVATSDWPRSYVKTYPRLPALPLSARAAASRLRGASPPERHVATDSRRVRSISFRVGAGGIQPNEEDSQCWLVSARTSPTPTSWRP